MLVALQNSPPTFVPLWDGMWKQGHRQVIRSQGSCPQNGFSAVIKYTPEGFLTPSVMGGNGKMMTISGPGNTLLQITESASTLIVGFQPPKNEKWILMYEPSSP